MNTYDRQGNPISDKEFYFLFQDKDYQAVRKTEIGDVLVSTVWLGLDYSFGRTEKPLIFETMIFGMGHEDEECYRYSTEEEAIEGHEKLVTQLEAVRAVVD